MEGPEETLIDRLEESMVDAFTKRLIADVPVGVFSPGRRLSLVTAILAKHTCTPIKTFTIGFREKTTTSRAGKADRPASGHRAYGKDRDAGSCTGDPSLWPRYMTSPSGTSSGIPTTIVSRMTRRHVKVSLSADGGDELFCGYHATG